MKKTPMIIIVPAITIAIILGGALVYKLFTGTPQPATGTSKQFPDSLSNSQTSAPSTFLGSLFGGEKPTPTPATAVDLSNELKSTYDDGGQSDLDAIAKDASGL